MATRKMKFEDWLDDLCVRFIMNLPQADLTSMARICFLVEEAHWFYEDFIRPLDNTLPSMNLRNFCLAIFQRCPLLAPFPIQDHVRAFEEFLKYKTSVPVRGAILLNETMDMALLVKGWKKGAHWSFPKGKIAMDEDDLDCAIREVDEETGFDVRVAGLVPPPEEVKFIETTFRDQQIRLYVFRNVPMDTHFEPKTRKEISKIQWYKITDLPSYRKKNAASTGNNNANGNGNSGHHHHPGHETDDPASVPNANKFYMVAPFIGPLKKWVSIQRKKDAIRAGHDHLAPQTSLAEDAYTEDETSAQPEMVQHFQRSGDPEDILANASKELQRLLKMPPLSSTQPTQAPVAPVPATAGFADPNQNKANALLAVLQKGGSSSLRYDAPSPAGNAGSGPHTPLDHNYSQAPQPNTPHHHHPVQQPLYPQQQAPPPPFHQQMQQVDRPIQDQPAPAYNQFGAPRPDLPQYQYQQQQQQQQQAQQYQQHQQRLQQQQGQPPQNFRYQQPIQGQNANPFAPITQNPPPPYTLQASDNSQAQQAAASFHPQQPPPPPVPLLHPQPLPPTVQKALFARESLVSPDVSLAGPYTAGHQGNMMMPPPPPPQHRGQQPPLSNHAVSLLNAFKKADDNARPGVIQAGPGAPSWQQQPPQQHQQQPQQPPQQPQQPQQLQQHQQPQEPQQFRAFSQGHQLHGARPQPGPQQQYGGPHTGAVPPPFAGQIPSNTINSIVNSNNNNNSNPFQPINAPPAANGAPQFNTAPRLVQHTEQHRNALLGMFKQPVPSPQAPAPAAAPVPLQHSSGGHGAGPGGPQSVTTQRTVYTTTTVSTGQAIEAAARANGGPVEMNAEQNLPFGALSLLTRPKGSSEADRSQQHPSTYATPIAELPAGTTATLRQQLSIPPHQANQPFAGRQQVDSPSERRPSTRGSQQYSGAALPQHGAVRRPSFASSSSTAPVGGGPFSHAAQQQPQPQPQHQQQVPAAGGRRPDQNPEQKQKLLSLFSKQPQMSPTGGASMGHAPPGSVSSGGSVDHTGAKGKARDMTAAVVPGDGGGGGPAAASRRGSQTPISPADRNFLLGYLASKSKT